MIIQKRLDPGVKTTYMTHKLSNLNPEGKVSSFRIHRFIANCISKQKWAWQAQFLSHTLHILQINTTFGDVQMIFL